MTAVGIPKQSRRCEWCGKRLKSGQKKFCSNSHSARFRYASPEEREAHRQKQEKIRYKTQSNLIQENHIDKRPYAYVYALIDPRYHCVRYVGQSRKPKNRFSAHLYRANYGIRHISDNHSLYDWIKELLEINMKPTMVLIQKITSKTVRAVEEDWIQYGLECGWPLFNRTRRKRQ